MTEHPILFSAEMVCAILDGRKTQTRRVIQPQQLGGRRIGVTDETEMALLSDVLVGSVCADCLDHRMLEDEM